MTAKESSEPLIWSEHSEVMVTGNMCPQVEMNRVSNAVCLLKSGSGVPGKGWKATGFYVKIEISSEKNMVIHCIMTNYHVFHEVENVNEMIAVFHFVGDNESPVEVVLRPSHLHAECKELDYALIRVDKKHMCSLKIEPIDAGFPKVDKLSLYDIVHIFQHPKGREKHISSNNIKTINPPFIHYYADTLSGSSGSPVIVVVGNKCALAALHYKGVQASPSNYNKGILMSEILSHLNTGKYTKPGLNVAPGVPGMLESARIVPADSKESRLLVTEEDIKNIPVHIVKVWEALARALGLPRYIVDSIDKDYDTVYEKSYQMLTKWKQTKVSKANYEALATAFRDPAVGRDDLVSQFC